MFLSIIWSLPIIHSTGNVLTLLKLLFLSAQVTPNFFKCPSYPQWPKLPQLTVLKWSFDPERSKKKTTHKYIHRCCHVSIEENEVSFLKLTQTLRFWVHPYDQVWMLWHQIKLPHKSHIYSIYGVCCGLPDGLCGFALSFVCKDMSGRFDCYCEPVVIYHSKRFNSSSPI